MYILLVLKKSMVYHFRLFSTVLLVATQKKVWRLTAGLTNRSPVTYSDPCTNFKGGVTNMKKKKKKKKRPGRTF